MTRVDQILVFTNNKLHCVQETTLCITIDNYYILRNILRSIYYLWFNKLQYTVYNNTPLIRLHM